MTRKDRITAAFRNGTPDRVPVSPELWDAIPFRVTGRPFYELGGTSFARSPLWRAQLDAYRFFGCEAWIPVEPAPSAGQAGMVEARSSFTGTDTIRTEVRYRTSLGTLESVKISTPDYDMWNATAPVKDLLRDMPAVEEYFFDDPDSLDYAPIREAYEATGDDGICEGIVGNTFFEFLTLSREGGAVQVILDLQDHPDYLGKLRERYASYLAAVAERICDRTPAEGLFLNCGSSTLTVVSPGLFRTWDLPVVQAVAAVARRRGKIFHYHLHGKGRGLLEMLVDAGVTMLCPLECPPHGDFLLGEVKERFNGLAVKGGIDPFLLRDADDEEIERLVRRCLEEGAPRGGFTLATGDGVLKETPFDRIRLVVELAHKLGTY